MITIDTNLLVRLFIEDDAEQAAAARDELERAGGVVITAPVLCELAWVLRRYYRMPRDTLAAILDGLTRIPKARIDREAMDAGVAALRAGGDFADAVIARLGEREGATVFVSFDRKAVRVLNGLGLASRAPTTA